MKNRVLYGAIASSQDETEVANKVKGVVLALSGVIILVASQAFHLTLTANDVIALGGELGTLAGALWAIYGVVLHIVTFFGSKKV